MFTSPLLWLRHFTVNFEKSPAATDTNSERAIQMCFEKKLIKKNIPEYVSSLTHTFPCKLKSVKKTNGKAHAIKSFLNYICVADRQKLYQEKPA